MSNKVNLVTMNQEKKRELKPKLRFPEFRDVKEWEKKNITEIAETSIGLVTTMTSSYSEKGVPLIRNSDIQPNKVRKEKLVFLLENFADKYINKKLKEGDIVTVHTGDIGVSAVIDKKLNGCLGFATLNTRLLKPDILPQFVCWYFNTKTYINFAISMATGDGRNNFNLKDFEKSSIPIPSLSEQQKIIDCLISIDDRITAESQKLDTLKAHKKGLMQQLFPAEGETLPKLRFPEFRDSGEWEEKHLGEIIEVASGQIDPTEPPYCDLPHIGGENIESHTGNLHAVKTARELRLISGKYLFNEGDILYSKIRPALNKVAIPDFKGICSADIYPLRPSDEKLCRRYLAYLLLSETFLEYATKHSDRSKIPKINRDSLLAYKVVIPHPFEQQRIADCLTSLEDLIAAQSQAIAALKLHKKGLMQQLFPSVEQVKR